VTSSRIRLQTAVLGIILFPAVTGVLVVHASQTCERVVRTYVSKPVCNQVSKATAAAWAKWRIAHPNWKPNPKLHRPKYVMSREEAVNNLNFACSIPTDPASLDLLFTPADIDIPPPIVNLPPMKATLIDFPDEVPPEVSEIPPDNTWPPFAPYIPPILGDSSGNNFPTLPVIVPPPPPPIVGPIPEPPSFFLVALGIGVVGLIVRTKKCHASAA
jgi:hypothetical protein